MSEGAQKRKQGPGAASGGGSAHKRSKGGNAGKWKTPHQKGKLADRVDLGNALDVGDEGIWVTFARGMRTKAVREFKELCEEYGEELYGIKPTRVEDASVGAEDQEDRDIEASIQQELRSMKEPRQAKSRQLFSPVPANVECLFFMKTMKPVQPGAFVRKICEDARECPDPRQRKCKYINRLTPVFDTDKATENGIVRVARTVLSSWFALTGGSEEEASKTVAESLADESTPAYTYAIRHNVRNHTTFKSEDVIKKIASLIDPKHKVNLGNPDKVILVEIFQLFCGISVVDGEEWGALKRYNLNALYGMSPEEKEGKKTPQGVGDL